MVMETIDDQSASLKPRLFAYDSIGKIPWYFSIDLSNVEYNVMNSVTPNMIRWAMQLQTVWLVDCEAL